MGGHIETIGVEFLQFALVGFLPVNIEGGSEAAWFDLCIERILIHDGATYHTSKATRAFIESVKERLTVYRLPSYSPDYNPIEQLWKKIKKEGTHNKYFPHFQDLKDNVDEALTYFQNQAKEVLSLMLSYKKLAPAA